MRKLEDKQNTRKGVRALRSGPAKRKRIQFCRMGNIKEFQYDEHTISEESREEMGMEKPYWKR